MGVQIISSLQGTIPSPQHRQDITLTPPTHPQYSSVTRRDTSPRFACVFSRGTTCSKSAPIATGLQPEHVLLIKVHRQTFWPSWEHSITSVTHCVTSNQTLEIRIAVNLDTLQMIHDIPRSKSPNLPTLEDCFCTN